MSELSEQISELFTSIIRDPLNLAPQQPRITESEWREAHEMLGWKNITLTNKTIVTSQEKCPYCGNTSDKRDPRGNCIACGGVR